MGLSTYKAPTTEAEAWERFAEIYALALVEAWEAGNLTIKEQGQSLESSTLSEAA